MRVRIAPNSSSCSINGVFSDASGVQYLKVSVNAVPEKGKANKELIAFLAKFLKIAKSRLTIVSGETDRCKKICIAAEDVEADCIWEKLNGEAGNDS